TGGHARYLGDSRRSAGPGPGQAHHRGAEVGGEGPHESSNEASISGPGRRRLAHGSLQSTTDHRVGRRARQGQVPRSDARPDPRLFRRAGHAPRQPAHWPDQYLRQPLFPARRSAAQNYQELAFRGAPRRRPSEVFHGIGATCGAFSALASTSAVTFWKSARPRRASKSGSLSSSVRHQPALTASRKAATDWSANAAASTVVTPD